MCMSRSKDPLRELGGRLGGRLSLASVTQSLFDSTVELCGRLGLVDPHVELGSWRPLENMHLNSQMTSLNYFHPVHHCPFRTRDFLVELLSSANSGASIFIETDSSDAPVILRQSPDPFQTIRLLVKSFSTSSMLSFTSFSDTKNAEGLNLVTSQSQMAE